MRIGVDATCWSQRRGYGRHLRGLIHAASDLHPEHQLVMVTDSGGEPEFPFPASCKIVRVPAGRPTLAAAAADGSRSLTDMRRMGRTLSSVPLDVLLFPTVYSWVPTWSAAPQLLFVHDVIAERLPQHIFPNLQSRLRWNLKSLLALSQADLVATVSSYSQREICKQFGLARSRVAVVGEAPDAVFHPLDRAQLPPSAVARGLHPHGRIIVYVGGFNPHKNLTRLLVAFEKIASDSRYADVTLALVGDDSPDPFYSEHAQLRQYAGKPDLRGRVVFTGFLADEDLARLLNCATFLVLPSLMEGYGLPAMEAAACGLPTVVTEHSPLPQLLGEATLPIDPLNGAAITRAMDSLLADEGLRARMSAAARAATSKLGWPQAAADLIRVLESLGGKGEKV